MIRTALSLQGNSSRQVKESLSILMIKSVKQNDSTSRAMWSTTSNHKNNWNIVKIKPNTTTLKAMSIICIIVILAYANLSRALENRTDNELYHLRAQVHVYSICDVCFFFLLHKACEGRLLWYWH